MKHQFLSRYAVISALLITISVVTISTCSLKKESRDSMDMRQFVPNEIYGWKGQEDVAIYDRKNIFDYIDGAGEVYLSYSFQKVMVFRFIKAGGEPTIAVELFDMGSPEDAFGVFSHAREGEEQGIGQGSDYRGGLLCFWKANLFVCILSDRETPTAKKAVFDLAQKIAENIKVKGSPPQLLDFLPAEGLANQSARYFHLHTSLNYHYYLASENILNLNPQTEAVLARYQPSGSYLLCVRYPNREKAQAAFDDFLSAYIPEEKESGLAQIENDKWASAKLEGVFVVVVFDAPTKDFAQALSKTVHAKLLESTTSEVNP